MTHDDLNTEDGLNASIYYNKKSDTYALAYAGTNPKSWGDIKANIVQNFGFESAQYKQAMRVASIVSKRVGDSGLVFTGHSLGGGLTSAASLQTGRQGFTFNAAGLHRKTVGGSINQQSANSLISAYYSASDPLNKWQDRMPNLLNQAVGRRMVVSGAEGHSMQSMYDALRGGN
ncbi:hypothetical protein C1E23_17160 [Pseudoalteromonas phenolica]|uniref:Fungal lipase-like domain-containing protein n=1 Tax=Pseudoalteromonas phenolica TaxID=161398 RepID=A0A4Q7IJ64_9GAMM|nr:hypothetical protein [Pseudoalteromonas phenolica]RZQ51880.1 hypothetical protein C1E23_17160 [Pseudoalteromonas phenolica]